MEVFNCYNLIVVYNYWLTCFTNRDLSVCYYNYTGDGGLQLLQPHCCIMLADLSYKQRFLIRAMCLLL